MNLSPQDQAKKNAAYRAAHFIQNQMIVGLGTGTTSRFFIEALSYRIKNERLSLTAVIPSSYSSQQLAIKNNLPVCSLNEVLYVDVTVDGADEVDPLKRMIKGGGGAHVREKILASSSREMIVIIDESKLVNAIGRGKLPVEIVPFGSTATKKKLEAMGYLGTFRYGEDKEIFITENQNLIYDISFPNPPRTPEKDHERILFTPGVVDTGFFFHMASRIIVGYLDGQVKEFDPIHPSSD